MYDVAFALNPFKCCFILPPFHKLFHELLSIAVGIYKMQERRKKGKKNKECMKKVRRRCIQRVPPQKSLILLQHQGLFLFKF